MMKAKLETLEMKHAELELSQAQLRRNVKVLTHKYDDLQSQYENLGLHNCIMCSNYFFFIFLVAIIMAFILSSYRL